MDTKDFKTLFGEVARIHGFTAAHGGWYRELPAALFVLDLQKSNLGAYYELNLKLFLSRELPREAAVFKQLIKRMSGDIFRRQPNEYRGAFDLDSNMDLAERSRLLEDMFGDVVGEIVAGAAAPAGILRLREKGVLFILPSIETQLRAS